MGIVGDGTRESIFLTKACAWGENCKKNKYKHYIEIYVNDLVVLLLHK